MKEIDKEYASRIKELEDLYLNAKLVNQKGEKINPNVDLNSSYAFLWY